MAINNYVPVKVLHDEISALISEATLTCREARLERAFEIYRLGLIDDLQYRDLNREICKRFPPDESVIPADVAKAAVHPDESLCSDGLSNSELILISEQLSVRMEQLKYLADKYVHAPDYEFMAERHRKELAAVVSVSNKIVKMINYAKSGVNKNEG